MEMQQLQCLNNKVVLISISVWRSTWGEGPREGGVMFLYYNINL